MTREECDHLVDSYLDWLRRGLSVERIGRACELTTPFLDRHNDHLQIYASQQNGKILLTDDGAIFADLKMSGVNLISERRKSLLNEILNGLGVHRREERLEVEASPKNLGQRIHQLLQAMLAINDMFVLSQPRVESLFLEDVRSFLDANEVRYSPMVKLSGKTGFDHAVNFLIPRSKAQPERIGQAINAPSKNTISHYLFVLQDTREAREEGSKAFAFLNDYDREIGGDVLEALEAYDVSSIPWSRREDNIAFLAN